MPQNILVVKTRGLGDGALGTSALQFLKKVWPHSRISYAIPQWIRPLFQDVETDADDYYSFDLAKIGDWQKQFRMLTAGKYDLIIELHQTGRNAKFFKLFRLFNKTPYFFHNHNIGRGPADFTLDQGVVKPIIQRDLDACWSVAKNLGVNLPVPHYLDFPPKMKLKVPASNTIQKIILGV
ncbi:MAG: hypothetical protein WCG27_12920, partial [Pseudomonadota bacterium]